MNKVKCKLCESEIKPVEGDLIQCRCKEICIDGLNYRIITKHEENLIIIDDEKLNKESEILKTIQEDSQLDLQEINKEITSKPTRKDLLDMLDEMIKNIEHLPQHAMTLPINHYDWASMLLLLSNFLHADN